MRFSKPVLASACEAASQVMRLERPADGMLSAFFRAHPQLGRQDRALVAETVFAMLRRRRLLEHLLPGAGLKEVVLASWALLLGANLRELEGLAPPRTLAAIERAKAGMHGPLPLAIACDLPDWLEIGRAHV